MPEVGWSQGIEQGVWRVCSSGKVGVQILLATPTLLQACHPVAAGTVIHTTIIECQGVWECCARSRMVAGHRAWGVEGVRV